MKNYGGDIWEFHLINSTKFRRENLVPCLITNNLLRIPRSAQCFEWILVYSGIPCRFTISKCALAALFSKKPLFESCLLEGLALTCLILIWTLASCPGLLGNSRSFSFSLLTPVRLSSTPSTPPTDDLRPTSSFCRTIWPLLGLNPSKPPKKTGKYLPLPSFHRSFSPLLCLSHRYLRR